MTAPTPAPTHDPTRLAPEDAFTIRPRTSIADGSASAPSTARRVVSPRKAREQRRSRSRSRRRKEKKNTGPVWQKLLWVKHPYPDNYTDEATFLDRLQRNPRLQPYEFWPLVADSSVVVQQVCTTVLFVCCFSGIIQERVSPISVVGFGTACALVGWVLLDLWAGVGHGFNGALPLKEPREDENENGNVSAPSGVDAADMADLALQTPNGSTIRAGSRQPVRAPSSRSSSSAKSNTNRGHSPVPPNGYSSPPRSLGAISPARTQPPAQYPPPWPPQSRFSIRTQQRLATAKSAVLIYCALLGLSPILKSLTKSTASDSIWAISFWLMCINVFFFDYGGSIGANFPASLSTNAALMASTVLASRLPSTTHVFSLTLFSIEVFGLFPAFRRFLRHASWNGHLVLTWLLVMGAGAGVALSVSADPSWTTAAMGVVLGCLLTGLAMGLCSWWLIGLQQYKNEIYGPWDPARPIIRRRWDWD